MSAPRLFANVARTGTTTLGVMLLGVALVCLVWLLLGLAAARELSTVEARVAESQRQALRSATLASTIRVQVVLASVTLRDLLLETDPDVAREHVGQIDEAHASATWAITEFGRLAEGPEERAVYDHLVEQADDYWQTIDQVRPSAIPVAPAERFRSLRDDVVLKRRAVLHLAGRAEDVLLARTTRHQQELAAIHATARRHLWWSGIIALVLSTGIAFVGARRIRALEDILDRQRQEDLRKTRELKRLSVRLMTAQDDERRSMARELHDEVGQALTALKLELGLVQGKLDRGGPVAHALEPARSLAERVLDDVRDLSRLLHPAVLDDFGLTTSLERYLGAFEKRTGVRTTFESSVGDQRFAPEVETCVYRSVQEALTNIIRHADASTCEVSLAHDDDVLTATVSDDGRGFGSEEGAQEREGLGLIGLGERVATLNGTLRVTSRIGGGTRLTVQVPAAVVTPPREEAS